MDAAAGLMTKKEYKRQQKMQEKQQKKLSKKMKSGVSDAMELYRLQKKVRKPITFGKIVFWLLLFIVLVVAGLMLGVVFTVDRFDFLAALSEMFRTFGWPDLIGMMFN